VGIALALAAVVAVVAVVVVGGGDDEEPVRVEAAANEEPLPEREEVGEETGGPGGPDAEPAPPSTSPSSSTTSSTTTNGPPPPSFPRIDPAWVGIIRSFDIDNVPYSRAVAEADELTARGITADVLFSSQYGSMNPGYWVVYSGVFSSRDQASDHCVSIQPMLFATCYPREADFYVAATPPAGGR